MSLSPESRLGPRVGAGDRRRLPPAVFFPLFFLSGAAALADEVVWFKYLNLTFGNTTAATATLLAVFMGGLALGSQLARRFAARLSRPNLVFAALEAGVGAFALLTPYAFALIERIYVLSYPHLGEGPGWVVFVRVVLSAAALVPPTVLMGASFPVLVGNVSAGDRSGRRVALLYVINTAGAVTGVALCGFLLIPAIGLRATLAASACASLIAALLATMTRGRSLSSAPAPLPPIIPRLWLLLGFLTGAAAMADEVLWTRILVLYLGSSVYAFSLMLAIYLVGLVAGSAAGAAIPLRDPRRSLAATQAALAAAILLQVFAFAFYVKISLALAIRVLHVASWAGVLTAEGLTTAFFLFPPTALMGFTFALLLRASRSSEQDAPATAGAIYAVNTVGGIGGALLAGFAAIPALGSQNSLLATGLLAAVLAFVLAPRQRWAQLAPIVFLLLSLLPRRDGVILSAGVFSDVAAPDLLFYHEDVMATVAVKRYRVPRPNLSMELNGVNVAGTSPELVLTQKLQAHLPLSFCARPLRVLHIGLGSGGTAYSVSLHPVSEIRIVEISPEVAKTAARYFQGVNHGVLSDPRVRLTINDGRNFVLAAPESFDVILSDSIHPRYAGNGSLYTEEYFRLCARRLRPGGVISMWLPMYSLLPENYRSIVRAFHDVFPNVSIWYPRAVENPFTIVLATSGRTVRLEDFQRALSPPAVAADLERVGYSDPAEVLADLLLAPGEVDAWVARASPHTDDLPVVEYESGRLLEADRTWYETFSALLARRSRIEDFVEGLRPDDPLSQRVLSRFRSSREDLEHHRENLARRIRGSL